MGTNYYLEQNCCVTCGRGESQLHIGKSSGGWCFALHVMLEDGILNIDDWEDLWSIPGNVIKDEYDRITTPEEMSSVIRERRWDRSKEPTEEFLRRNHAIPGPNGLMRHAIGDHCVGHGSGTWDLITGEFS